MPDWKLNDLLRRLPVNDFNGLHRCPRCGLALERYFAAWDPYRLVGRFPLGRGVHLNQDFNGLSDAGVDTVYQLLDAQPWQLTARTGIPAERISGYRFRARELVLSEAWSAKHHLWHKFDDRVAKITPGLALRISEQLSTAQGGGRFEVVVSMKDKLEFESLLEMTASERLNLRQGHSTRSQRELISELGLGEFGTDGEYLRVWLSNQFIASLTPDQILRAGSNESVAMIGSALPVQSCMDQVMTRISATSIRSKRSGRGQIVALLDSGVNSLHPDLSSASIIHKNHYVGSNTDDEFGHGTHLAGVIASNHQQYRGVAPDAKIWSYRVLDKNGKSASTATLVSAIQDVVTDASALTPHQLVIANCSFAVPLSSFASDQDYELFCDPFDAATSDLVVVAAAGNEGPDPASITAPGGGFRVITVGASVSRPGASLNFISPYSSRGPATGNRDKPDVVAPGGIRNIQGDAHQNVSVVSSRLTPGTLDAMTSNGKPWQVDAEHFGLSGTSQATAVVSGICALLLEDVATKGRTVKHSQIANALRDGATDLGFRVYEQGEGLIDVDKASQKI